MGESNRYNWRYRGYGLRRLHLVQRSYNLCPCHPSSAYSHSHPFHWQICGTNIGATILLARVLQLWTSSTGTAVDQRTRDGALFALDIGSNYGAFTLTFSGSLAGLLWRSILRQKGIHVRARQFLLLNLPVSFVAMLCSLAALVGEVYIIDKREA